MQTTFTKQFIQDNCGCYSEIELNNCSFMKTESITLDSIVDSEIPLKDKFWFCCKKVFAKEQNQQIAILCAEAVLNIYENKYPNDDRPRKAIQAAKDYLSGKITTEELHIARHAAYAAAYDAAAYDAAAAYAAAAAAATYAAAAAAATYAADAADAADAAVAAAATYAADALQTTLLTLLKDFIKNNEK